MRRLLRWAAALAAVAAVAAITAATVVLAASGVLRTAPADWVIEIPVLGYPLRANVAGLVRLATAPGAARWLDGRQLTTSAGTLAFAHEAGRLLIRCAPCTLRHAELSARAVTFARIEIALARSGEQLAGVLRVDAVELPFAAQLASDHIALDWTLPATPIAAIYRALASAIPEAAQARIEGTVQAEGRLRLPERRASTQLSLHGFSVAGLGTESLQSGWFRLPCAGADGSARTVLTGDGEAAWLAAAELGPYLAAAVVAAEDQRFHAHAGIDEREIAHLLDGLDGAPRRGASTITQQLARTLYTGPERSAVRKLREILYATEMERTLNKARILELYLNTVDWGPGLCGAKSAARAYFNKPPRRLTPIEAAWLASILRNPHAAHAAQFVARAPERERALAVLRQMRDWPAHERARWAQEPLAFAAPRRSAHTARTEAAQAPATASLAAQP